MSTAIVVSPYERMVADYFDEVKGYLCKTDLQFLRKSKKGKVRSDIDILAYKPKENRFLVCEVISYTPTTKRNKETIEKKIDIILGSDMKRFLKKYYGVEDYDKMLVVWTIPEWLRDRVKNVNIDLFSFNDILLHSLLYLKEKREEKGGWVAVTNVTMLVLQTVLHFGEDLEMLQAVSN